MFDGLTVVELKAKCDRLGVSKTGKKADLVKRLKAATPMKPKSKSKPKRSSSRGRSPAKPKKAGTPKKSASPSRRSSSRSKAATSAPRSPSPAPSTSEASPHCFIFEAPLPPSCLLTPSGASNIASHAYKAGGSTTFDDFMNPYWNSWVSHLPHWMAPNLVTTLGGSFCLLSYALVMYHSPSLDSAVPPWVFLVCGFNTWAYYTLDCLDGKQARRTGTSSPLGQLFDHGVDCLGNISHFTAIGAALAAGPTRLALAGQVSLQFSFFVAQWQEYHLRSLPHKFGELGVTEVNHLQALTLAAFGAFGLAGYDTAGAMNTAVLSNGMKANECVIIGWIVLNVVLICISLNMTVVQTSNYKSLLHLFSPLLACLPVLILPPGCLSVNFGLVSACTGLLFGYVTNKMIVFSMARMTYGTLQPDVLAILAAACASRGPLTEYGATVLWRAAVCWQLCRFVAWSRGAIKQLCARLGVRCFRIEYKKE
mmetsp:Transcript_26687/g.55704  ORF Transcript_26687/g.55704 Transcript_26687/m.55704 type:complete len:480 (+) Transcript_26687:3-1442(+)